MNLDGTDRAIVNRLQHGLPVCEQPFLAVAAELAIDEPELLARLRRLLDDGVLSRFGPMFNVERMGGCFTLCALRVPEERFDEVADEVNALEAVAHNYRREHRYNMWFVLATPSAAGTRAAVDLVEQRTGLEVLTLPKLEEYFVGLHLAV